MIVWQVKDFYSDLESRSEQGAVFSSVFFALAVVSALVATGGLLANSVAVIIGSMCIAPYLGSSRAICIGLAYRKWDTVIKGVLKQLIGLLVLGSSTAFLITLFFSQFSPDIIVTSEIMARTLPTLKDVYLAVFIAVASGAASSLALLATTRRAPEPYPELLDAMIGVEIAISLIPPASVIGIGLAFGQFDLSLHAFSLLTINMIGLDVVGSLIILSLWGITPELLQLEQKMKEVTKRIIKKTIKIENLSTEVTLLKRSKVKIDIILHKPLRESKLQSLTNIISKGIKKETGVSNTVKLKVLPTYLQSS